MNLFYILRSILITTSTLLCLAINTLTVVAEPFEIAKQGFPFAFPKDHGSHPNFKTEWWYFTGTLYQEGKVPFRDAPAFGYQLTFFRQKQEQGHGFLAHAAISDFEQGKHYFDSLKAPALFDFAGSLESRLKAWNKHWLAEFIQTKILLKFSVKDFAANMLLNADPNNPVLQGENGYSKKGSCPQCASQYVSYSRSTTAVDLYNKDKLIQLHGLSWMDHEFMSNTLQDNQVGWDWFSLMTKDGTELMLFRVRGKDSKDDYYSGSCIRGSTVTTLTAADFTITPTAFWTHNNTKYPAAWTIESKTCNNFRAEIKTRISNQLLSFPNENVSSYYEGAVHTADESVIGYVELTGYERPIGNAL
jgi:predicted secreted hydrolase